MYCGIEIEVSESTISKAVCWTVLLEKLGTNSKVKSAVVFFAVSVQFWMLEGTFSNVTYNSDFYVNVWLKFLENL